MASLGSTKIFGNLTVTSDVDIKGAFLLNGEMSASSYNIFNFLNPTDLSSTKLLFDTEDYLSFQFRDTDITKGLKISNYDSTVVRLNRFGQSRFVNGLILDNKLTFTNTAQPAIEIPLQTNVPDVPTTEKQKLISVGSNGGLYQVSGRGGLMLSSNDDSLILANGDIGRTFNNTHLNAGEEGMYFFSDGVINFKSNLQNGWGSENTMSFTQNGDLIIDGGTVWHSNNLSEPVNSSDLSQVAFSGDHSDINFVGNFNVNGSTGSAFENGIYVSDSGGAVGSTNNPLYTAILSAQTGNHRSIHLSVDDNGYIWGLRSHSNAGTYTFQSKTKQADVADVANSVDWDNITGSKPNLDQFTRNGKTIALSGDVSGTGTVGNDGSISVTNTVVANDSHSHSNYIVKSSNATLNHLQLVNGGQLSSVSGYMTVFGQDNTGVAIYGGGAHNTGGGFVTYGNQHPSKAGETWFYSDGFTEQMVIKNDGVEFVRGLKAAGDVSITKNNPWLTLDSSSGGAEGVEQAAGISVGESGKKGDAAIHMTYTGDGKGWIGMGVVSATTSIPDHWTMQLHYQSNNVTFRDTPNVNGNVIWHAGNDGSGSGLDADLLDGIDSSSFMRSKFANGYHGLTAPGNNDSNWIRTTINGLIPYSSGGASSLGTSSWPFNNIYARNIYDNGTLLEDKYLGKNSKAVDSDKLDGLHENAFMRRTANSNLDMGTYNLLHKNPNNTNSVAEIGWGNNYLRYRFGGSGETLGVRFDDYDSPRISLNRDGTIVNTSYTESAGFVSSGGTGLYLTAPGGGTYKNTSSTETGYIKIRLPQSWTNTMMKFRVSVFDYAGNESFDVIISGYNYTNAWKNPSATIICDTSINRNFTVRFGHDGTKCAVYIGESNTTWGYPQIAVTEFHGGYSNYSPSQWNDGWQISVTTSLGTITSTQANNQLGKFVDAHTVWHAGNDGAGSGLDADLLDGLDSSQFFRTTSSNTYSRNNGTTVFQNTAGDVGNVSSGGRGALEVNQPTSGKDAFMTFHVGGDYAAYFGLSGAENDFFVGGWSMGANKYRIWHEGNSNFITRHTSNRYAVSGETVVANSSGMSVYLPSNPKQNDKVGVVVGGNYTNVVVNRNTKSIMGLNENMTLDVPYASAQFMYDGTTWRLL